jgi:hypothetical protein
LVEDELVALLKSKYRMNIYALKGPSFADYEDEGELEEVQSFLADSIRAGAS